MFVGDEVLVAVSFDAARSRLARLAAGGVLLSTSQNAYGDGMAGGTRVGAAGVSKLVRVPVAELAAVADSAGLAIRWEATGAGGGLFPVLDADIRLTPAGEEMTLLALTGAYRPPLGPLGEALDRAIMRRVATATIRNFINRLAAALAGQHNPTGAAVGGCEQPAPDGGK
jgi:carbon monoxide dehydrogenase subunit G